ncbi:MAG: hypothetical protein CFE21_13675 [Bacteroidetes bacterium B1(2017)]|nr:MAG: hypothetical protein CFE21_13675 [Bacteroidetes bacterium B1(2017)]
MKYSFPYKPLATANTSLLRHYLQENGGYYFHFNGQESDNEIAGIGNINTAEFWEYDARLGRRWNLDPITKPHESSYSCFSNNPIWNVDKLGNDTTNGFVNSQSRDEFNQIYNELNNRIDKVAKDIYNLEDKEKLSNKDVRNLNTLKNQLEGYLKIKKAFDEVISNKDIKYWFHSSKNIGQFEDGKTGEQNGLVYIIWETGNSTALVHEIRHGYGYIKKEWKTGDGYDYMDELEAWNFTQIWDSSKVIDYLNKASQYVYPELRMNFDLRMMIELKYVDKVQYQDWIQHKVK